MLKNTHLWLPASLRTRLKSRPAAVASCFGNLTMLAGLVQFLIRRKRVTWGTSL